MGICCDDVVYIQVDVDQGIVFAANDAVVARVRTFDNADAAVEMEVCVILWEIRRNCICQC